MKIIHSADYYWFLCQFSVLFLLLILFFLHLVHTRKHYVSLFAYLISNLILFQVMNNNRWAMVLPLLHLGYLCFLKWIFDEEKEGNRLAYYISILYFANTQSLMAAYPFHFTYFWYFFLFSILAIALCPVLIVTYIRKRDEMVVFEDVSSFFDSILLFLLFLLFCMVLIMCFFSGKRYELSGSWRIDFILLFVFLFLLYIRSLWKENKYRKQKRELYNYKKYNPNLEQLIDEVREVQHDYKNHMQTIISLSSTCSSIEEFQDEMKKISVNVYRDMAYPDILRMNNKLIAGLLYTKIKEAEEKNIVFTLKRLEGSFQAKEQDPNLIRVIGILLDNAIEAESGIEAPHILLSLFNRDKSVILVQNKYPELSHAVLDNMWKRGYSTKPSNNQIGRGLGLSIVKKLVKTDNGIIMAYNEMINGTNYVCIKIEL